MRLTAITVILAFLLSVCSCGSGSKIGAEWEEIDRLCDSVPEEAVGILDTIDQTGMSEKDLNRFRLLWIKSRDKAFIVHTSDTLILDVVDYYARHRSEGLYAEALYYGGRVYSDLGDLPTALEFFQKSLDEIPEDDTYLHFKSTVLNQTGRLLHTLRLDSAAIEYLEKSLQTNHDRDKDYYNVAFTHSLIAESYKGQKEIKTARRHIDEAIRLGSQLYYSERQTIQCEFADFLLNEGKTDSALIVIRPLPYEVDSVTASYCLAVAADTYKEVGILDTAYMYARKLTALENPNNKKTGYHVIFSEEMKQYVPKDTLLTLIPEYKQVIEDYLDTHGAEQALIQNARYNYSTHIRQREKMKEELRSLKEKVWIGGSGLTIMILIIGFVMLWHKYHQARNDAQIMEGIIMTDKLKDQKISVAEENRIEINSELHVPRVMEEKQQILEEIKKTREMKPSESIDKTLKSASLYKDLKERSDNKKVMGHDVTWRMIEDLIESVSPGFDYRLDVLAGGQITQAERNVAYLLKCGFTQTQIASLLAKSASTISAQRTSLAKKIGYDKSAIAAIIVRL